MLNMKWKNVKVIQVYELLDGMFVVELNYIMLIDTIITLNSVNKQV